MRAAGLPVPARHPRQPVGDVFDLDVERGWIEQIEPSSRQHPLPRTGVRLRAPAGHFTLRRGLRGAAPQVSWQKQLTRWSLTIPVACMKA